MKRKNLILGIVATTLVVGVAAFSAAPIFAHGSQGYGSQGYGGQMGHAYSQGMMGHGQGYGMMGQGMMGQSMMDHGQGYGMMGQGPCNQAQQSGIDRNLGVDDVKGIVESRLAMHGNDRLKVGKVEATGENTIVVEIVTVDDSLVHKIEFDRKTGAHHPIK